MEKNREQYKRLIMFVASSFIVLLQTVIFAKIWFDYYVEGDILVNPFWERGNYVVVIQYALMIFLFYKLYGGFKVGYLKVFEVIYSQVLSVLCVNAITYIQLCLIVHMKFLSHLKPILVMTALDLVVVLIWVVFMRWIYAKIYPPRKLVLVYGEYSPDGLIKKMAAREDKFAIQETVSCAEDLDFILSKIREYDGVILADVDVGIRNKLLKFCFRNNIRCYSVPKISDIMIQNAEKIQLFDTTLLLFRNRGLTVEQKFFKRLFDIVASVAGLILASPFFVVIALAVKLYDGGPVFFEQDRLTKDGKIFKLYKFRSMRVVQENSEYCMTKKNDSRITPVGKVIRAMHLDELPQLFNILKGDMSMVGPRPECPKLAEEYRRIVPEFDMRLKVKAGLTGYAQVYGKYNTPPYDKLKLDLMYIQRYSLMLDIQLILLTVKVLLQKDSTEGIDEWQNSAATKENLEKMGGKNR